MTNRLDLFFWVIDRWLKGHIGYLSFIAHQVDLILWTIELWLRQCNGYLSFIAHQADMCLWAISLWTWRCKARELMALVFTVIVASAMLSWLEYTRNKPKYHRRTSRASAIGANRQFLEEALSMKQNVINTIFFFDESPSRAEFVSIMTTLVNKYERMGSVPEVDASGECVWYPIEELEGSIYKAVLLDSRYEAHTDIVHDLQRAHAHIGTILTSQDEEGRPMPLWRVVILSPTTALIRIDHSICDGLSAVTMLREVGVKTSSKKPLKLSDLSPILRAIEKAGDLRVALSPLKLLWPPSLVRAVSFLAHTLRLGKEPSNPLRPLREHVGSPVPSQSYGTVYFPTMPVNLFKDMSRAMGNGTTINDILLLCLSIAFGHYFDVFDEQGSGNTNINNIKILLPIGNTLRPSQYGDYYEGLCNRMTPIIVPLNIPRQKDAAPFSPRHANEEIKAYTERVKRSNTPLFMTCLNTILQPLLPLEKLKEAAKHSFECVSCVYSNVAGPTESISLQSRSPVDSKAPLETTHSYKINKIQVVMPHPVSLVQILSYDSSMFFNITLDTRAATQPWILRTAFVHAVSCVADETGVAEKWRDELTCFRDSKEWGGDIIVYNCGGEGEAGHSKTNYSLAHVLLKPTSKHSLMPQAA